jgi:hypothetical protein
MRRLYFVTSGTRKMTLRPMAALLQEEATAGGHQPDETAQQQRRQPATTGVPLPREVTFTGDAPQGWPTSRGYLGPVLFFF